MLLSIDAIVQFISQNEMDEGMYRGDKVLDG